MNGYFLRSKNLWFLINRSQVWLNMYRQKIILESFFVLNNFNRDDENWTNLQMKSDKFKLIALWLV